MSYTYLQEQGAESSVECFSDIPAYVLSRLSHTAAKCCSKGNETASCRGSLSGMTCEPSTESRGAGSLTLFAVDSHAKTSARRERAPESAVSDLDYGLKWQGSFAKYDPVTSSWKTPQCSLFGGLDEFSETWPQWGSILDGELLVHRTPAPSTTESEYGFLPTPLASDGDGGGCQRTKNGKEYNLRDWWANQGLGKRPRQRRPEFWEWAMGWPESWTGLEPLETAKFQQWLDSHGELLQKVA